MQSLGGTSVGAQGLSTLFPPTQGLDSLTFSITNFLPLFYLAGLNMNVAAISFLALLIIWQLGLSIFDRPSNHSSRPDGMQLGNMPPSSDRSSRRSTPVEFDNVSDMDRSQEGSQEGWQEGWQEG
jgi:hypothetical protein